MIDHHFGQDYYRQIIPLFLRLGFGHFRFFRFETSKSNRVLLRYYYNNSGLALIGTRINQPII